MLDPKWKNAGGQDWVDLLTRAQKKSFANWFMLGNAFIGSAECMKEFLYADQKRFNLVPIFIEGFCNDESTFEDKKGSWHVDHDLDAFEKWESKKDMIERLSFSRQGVPSFFDTADFVCDKCRTTRDIVCEDCTDWSRAMQTGSAHKLKESVGTLARYLSKESQLASVGNQLVGRSLDGIAKASTVVMLQSNEFKKSASCRTQALHAKKHNKPVIAVEVDGFQPHGWLQSLPMQHRLQGSSKSGFEATVKELLEQLGAPPDTLLPRQQLSKRSQSFSNRSQSRRIVLIDDGDSDDELPDASPASRHFRAGKNVAPGLSRTRSLSSSNAGLKGRLRTGSEGSSSRDADQLSITSASSANSKEHAQKPPPAPLCRPSSGAVAAVIAQNPPAPSSPGPADSGSNGNSQSLSALVPRRLTTTTSEPSFEQFPISSAKRVPLKAAASSPHLSMDAVARTTTSRQLLPPSSPQIQTGVGHHSLARLLSRSFSAIEGRGGEGTSEESNSGGRGELEEVLTILERTMTAEKEVQIAQLSAKHFEHKLQDERRQSQLEAKVAVMEAEHKMSKLHQAEKALLVKDVELREARSRVQGAICVGVAAGLVAVVLAVMTMRRS